MFSLLRTVYEVEEGETAVVCLVVADHDLLLIRFHLMITQLSGNATGVWLISCNSLNFLTFVRTMSLSGLDYWVQNQQDFTIGESSHSVSNDVCFNVFTVDDSVAERNETVTLQLQITTDVEWIVLQTPDKMDPKIVIHDNDGNKLFLHTQIIALSD